MKTTMLRRAAAGAALALGLGINAVQAQSVREACAADAAKFCPSARDLQVRQQCMAVHESELSAPCKAARGTQAGAEGQGQASGGARSGVVGSAQISPDPEGNFASIAMRMADRTYPATFGPWSAPDSLLQANGQAAPLPAGESPDATIARQDLFFATYKRLGLKLAPGKQYLVLTPEFAPESIQVALANRKKLLAANPNMLILTDLHYYADTRDALPADSPWWLGAQRANEYNTRKLDFSNPAFQDKVAALCAALLRTGVYDGCMMDWWHDDDPMGGDRLALIRKVRAAIGDKALLIGNVNNRLPARTAQYLNGMYMEGLGSSFFPDWRTAAANLLWGESHLRRPAITALEAWYPCPTQDCRGDPTQIQQQGRAEQARMRNVTALSLVFSNGYVLYSDPNALPTPDHLHDWYPFWDKSLGRPVGPLATLDRPDLSGAYTRRYEKGDVVFNPPSNRAVTIAFPEPRRSAATNASGRNFTVAPGDGDLFLKTP